MHPEFDPSARPRLPRRRCLRLAASSRAHPIRVRFLCACLIALLTMPSGIAAAAGVSSPAATDSAPATSANITPHEAQALNLLLTVLPARYGSADASHEPTLAAVSRAIAHGIRQRVLASAPALRASDPQRTARALGALDRLATLLQATTVRYQPWPLTLQVSALSALAQRELGAMLHPPRAPAHPYGEITAALEQATAGAGATDAAAGASAIGAAASTGDTQASFAALRAYALYAAGPGQRLATQDPALDAKITTKLLRGSASVPALTELLADGAPRSAVQGEAATVRSDMGLAAEALTEVTISHTTIVVNAAIIVFREGLEAVLILAAITASFVGAKRHLRRPVFIGALAGLGATALTWVIAQMLLHLLSNGGLELQAVTGVIAIGVLLLVTNWFFHRVYWSEWISRFNRRRKAIERWDRLGFISGQALGFVLLGLSSVYREGLETVLFLQAMQASAGTATTALGAGIGLGATLIVGGVTFKMQRKLPFKRMLILTGVLIALVLAVMVGTTMHNLQGIGWLASTPTSFHVPLSWSIWLGVYPTWEGIGAQLGALVFVLGSYFAAREIQVKRPQRQARRTGAHGAMGRLEESPGGFA
jgi:high-affinity iron transporter